MRRDEREAAGLADVLAILEKCEVLRLGLCEGNKPYIVPMNFAYETVNEELFIYLHTASSGKKLDMIAKNNNVCFESDCSYKTIEAGAACDWSAEYESVIGEGKITILNDLEKKVMALDALMIRYGFDGKPHYGSAALATVTVLQIQVRSITGKRNRLEG